MTSSADIKYLTGEISICRICSDVPLSVPLPHEPRPVVQLSSTARLCIAGQAPGARVHASSKPFTDPSGNRLRDWMNIAGRDFYDPAKLAIVPMGFCFPGNDAKGGDLPPRKECAQTWHESIFAAMPQVELILAIGQYAQTWHLKADCCKTLTETVRNWRKLFERKGMPKVLPLPHPSWRNTGWLKKNPWLETELLPVLRSEVQRLI